jgi:hypothetical protein
MLKEVVDFISAFQILPRHVSANGCHVRRVVGAFQATQAMLCVWAVRIVTCAVWPDVDSTATGHTGRTTP